MPIKLPKGFQRRKSSGNALDELPNPPEPSFKVIERPTNQGKSFDGGLSMRMASQPPRPPPKTSFDNYEEDLFSPAHVDTNNRGSGGTENSLSTAPYDSARSSIRLSTSTNPSSVDIRWDQNAQLPGQRPFNDIPVPPQPPRHGFLHNPARTFSFGVGIRNNNKSSPSSSPVAPPAGSSNHTGIFGHSSRDRAMTTSTASTATPPRLFDSDLALDSSELDGFGNMFDHIRSSPDPNPIRSTPQDAPASPEPTKYPPSSYPRAEPTRAPVPKPIVTDRSQAVESSLYSWTSQDSRDGLMRSPSPSRTVTQNSPAKSGEKVPPPSSQSPVSRPRLRGRNPISREDLSESSPSAEHLQPPVVAKTRSRDSNGQSASPTTSDRTGSPSPVSSRSATIDPSLAAGAELAAKYQEQKMAAAPKPPSVNKVMSPEEFERYKQQKEMDRRLGALSDDSDSGDGDKYDEEEDDDDDDKERQRRAVKQRRKQQAHLSVYRQTMMKVTGEQPLLARPASGMSNAIGRLGNGSASDLNNRLSHITLDATKPTGKSDREGEDEEEDEDEDVPLGILAAHGFPNKNRPPTRMANTPSNSNLRGLSQQQQSTVPSVAGEAAGRGSLPVFARNLPQDPYYGASLVNPSNRQSLAIHTPATVVSPPSGPATAHPIHPAGLVGVIAGEERARAMRRGSPNPQGTYDMPAGHPAMMRSQTTGNLPAAGYAGMPGMGPMLTPGDAAQIQMSQQMTQMMQMQMQWMQQMSQMMGPQAMQGPAAPQLQPNQLPPMAPNYLAPPNQIPRSQSIPMQSGPGAAPFPGQRTMSTLNPSMAPWNSTPSINLNGKYAHSIAPSERSNVGLASRYRPVSTVLESDTASTRRASTFTSATLRPWSQAGGGGTGLRFASHAVNLSGNQVGRKSPLAADDDDDEQGWAEMKMKKEKKQKTWALRKGQNALQELYNNAS